MAREMPTRPRWLRKRRSPTRWPAGARESYRRPRFKIQWNCLGGLLRLREDLKSSDLKWRGSGVINPFAK